MTVPPGPAPGGLPCTRDASGRAMRAPTANRIIKPRWKSEAGPGGHKARPYDKTGGWSVGAAFMAARAAPRVGSTIAERSHRKGAHRASVAGYDLRRAGGRCTWSRRADGGIGPYKSSGNKKTAQESEKTDSWAEIYVTIPR